MTFRAPEVSPLLLSETERFRQEVLNQVVRAELGRVKGVLDEFNYELKQIDPKLQLVRAAEVVSPGNPLKAGYYHIIRENDGAPPSVMVVEGPQGEFREPDSHLFEQLRANDLWNPENVRRAEKYKLRLEEARLKIKAREREERQEELKDRANAAWRTTVSMDRSRQWTQNSQGRRYVRKDS